MINTLLRNRSLAIIGISIGVIGVAATIYYGIKQINKGKSDTKEIKNMLENLRKKAKVDIK